MSAVNVLKKFRVIWIMDTPWDGKLPKSEEEKKKLCLFLKLKSELGTTLNEQKFLKKEISRLQIQNYH